MTGLRARLFFAWAVSVMTSYAGGGRVARNHSQVWRGPQMTTQRLGVLRWASERAYRIYSIVSRGL